MISICLQPQRNPCNTWGYSCLRISSVFLPLIIEATSKDSSGPSISLTLAQSTSLRTGQVKKALDVKIVGSQDQLEENLRMARKSDLALCKTSDLQSSLLLNVDIPASCHRLCKWNVWILTDICIQECCPLPPYVRTSVCMYICTVCIYVCM